MTLETEDGLRAGVKVDVSVTRGMELSIRVKSVLGESKAREIRIAFAVTTLI